MHVGRTVGLRVLAALLGTGVCLAQKADSDRCQVVPVGTAGYWRGFALRDGGVLVEVSFAAGGRW